MNAPPPCYLSASTSPRFVCRFYFTSKSRVFHAAFVTLKYVNGNVCAGEADLLDILSNGSSPHKVMRHIDKVLLATARLQLENVPDSRPRATIFVSGIGEEQVDFEPAVPLEGKVEVYLQTILTAQVETLQKNLERSRKRYPLRPRTEWFLDANADGQSSDPAQIALLVAGIQSVLGVEDAMDSIEQGEANALQVYADRQRQDLVDLVRLTQTNLKGGERQRVMCLITMDAYVLGSCTTFAHACFVGLLGSVGAARRPEGTFSSHPRADDLNLP